MNKKVVWSLIIAIVVVILIIIGIIIFGVLNARNIINDYQTDISGEENANVGNPETSGLECIELGCFEDTEFVGSKNSDKYYTCDCRFAKLVNKENIVCFASEEEAKSDERKRSEC